LALHIARQRLDVELVSVDSMSVYRGMDIGTAKPRPSERDEVPYHLLDLVEPSEEFTVRQFQVAAEHSLAQIAGRGHRSLLVGGTGLHLRAVVDRLEFPGRYPELAGKLEREADEPGGLTRLFARLAVLDPVGASRTTPENRRRVLRALEVTLGSGRPFSSFGPGLASYPPSPVLLVGIPFDPGTHDRRIEERFAAMVESGLVEEVRSLAQRPGGFSRTARQALGYREILTHLEDGVPLSDALSGALQRTKSFARRQWAWFRRDPRIRWVDPRGDLTEQVLELWDTEPQRGEEMRDWS
jgi:tRNA dimethylallyltransferase